MKSIKVFLFSAVLAVMMGITVPVMSQENPSSRTAPAENYDNDDDDPNYSWIGLLGLLGLAGLMRKDRDVTVRRTTTDPTPTNYAR